MAETVIPLRKNVVDTFAKEDNIIYAKHENGAVYVCNGHYMLKTNQAGVDYLKSQVNRRRRTADIGMKENKHILDYVKDSKGTFELTKKPHEVELDKNCTACFYADNKQYFAYNKRFVAILKNFDNRLFVDNNVSYDPYSHNLIAKSHTGEILGIALPIRLAEELYTTLADVLPLKVKRKSELERIKENPTKDPYIGKEFSDGRDNFIISALRKNNGINMYMVQEIENGKLSRHGELIESGKIEERVVCWKPDKAVKKQSYKKQLADGEKQAAKANAKNPAPKKSDKNKGAEERG
jgi:hypothetical protein